MEFKTQRTDLFFKNRIDAGQKLAIALKKFKGKDVVIFALTRGGVPVGKEVARGLNCPFEPLIIRKIGHPMNPEYAIGAISSGGQIVVNESEVSELDKNWFQQESEKQKEEAERRVKIFLRNHAPISITQKIAIIIDDGIATGFTMRAAIKEIKNRHPQKLVVAVPVAPPDTIEMIARQVDECIVLSVPDNFLGAVGSYYEDFHEVTDEDVLNILKHDETKE
jgi:predicted phosphoribosyltransferase